ncbi:Glycosyl transferase family 11 [Butyrivibrio fibrisolvens DSM 3071]|uniref:Glycosyl transferase family 11 n=1 Tax=Butyrivibrio fibrisolvens DSM 3071 TaxID=1121131 RepID=A0A1M5XU56_BUTFI|nr:alpha-1,2-fucosyltransferase [Butyrivibrio fibrisolvens]SHI03252.1 Glycosyl transferase family 11 [Butyrivibrio fibrisolvens DSM 3071]
MIIIKMQGGLGNQLFLYGLYKELLFLGREVKMDNNAGFIEDPLRDPVLSKLGISYDLAEDKEIRKMRDSYMDPLSRIRRKLTGRKNKDYYEALDGNFDETVLKADDIYLNGYFQSEKYFNDDSVRQELRADICKNKERYMSESDVADLRQEIANANSVSMHIRRGDYLTPVSKETYGGICTDEYYEKAMDLVKEKNPDARFYIFSNDIDWCKEKYKDTDNVSFVSLTGDDSDIKEFFLMSECRHHILANSSFSWWAAFLSAADDNKSLNIVPSKWTNTRQMKDIYASWMTRI